MEFIDMAADFDGLSDLLGRVVMLTPVLESVITKKLEHVLGTISPDRTTAHSFIAVVKRPAMI